MRPVLASLGVSLVVLGLAAPALGQQSVDEEVPGKHKKVVPPPPEPKPAAQAAPVQPGGTQPPAEGTGKKKKRGKKGKKERKAKEAEPEAAPAPAPPPPPAPEPPPPSPQQEDASRPAPIMAAPVLVAQPAPVRSGPAYLAGFRLRYITVPGWFLSAFTQDNVGLHSLSLAGEFIRRRGDLDIVGSLDFSFMSPGDGNWLGNSKSAAVDTDYVQFRGFNIFSLDVSFIWHHPIGERFQIEYGAGVGLGFVMGQILRTSDGSADCANNPGSVQACHPVLCATGPCDEATLAASMTAGHGDTAADPHRFVDDHVPPVIPVINLLVGAAYQLQPKVRLKLEAGFRNAFFLGLGSEYQF